MKIIQFLISLVLVPIFVHVQGKWTQPVILSALNSASADFAPVWNPFDSILVFCSMRDGKSHVYYSTRTFSEARISSIFPATKNLQISYVSYSVSGEMMYSAFKKYSKQSFLNLASSSLTNSTWSEPAFVDILNTDSFTAHPSISPSGNTVVFASDRLGSEGGTDLWMSTRTGNIWNVPVNIGEALNSAGDEITPFLVSDDSLYYSSNGLGGRGGYEIYFTSRIAGEWQAPLPVAELNTAFDESDFTLLPNGSAVFATNRPGGSGDLDLYVVYRSKQ